MVPNWQPEVEVGEAMVGVIATLQQWKQKWNVCSLKLVEEAFEQWARKQTQQQWKAQVQSKQVEASELVVEQL